MFYTCKAIAYGCAAVAGLCLALVYVQGGMTNTLNLLTFSILTGVSFIQANTAKVNANTQRVLDGIHK